MTVGDLVYLVDLFVDSLFVVYGVWVTVEFLGWVVGFRTC